MALTVLLLGAAAPARAVCGDGVRDGDEACDGADLGGATCASATDQFVRGGTVACTPDCKLDTSDCRRTFLESLVPGRGGQPNRCQMEWTAAGTSTKGTINKRLCADGDQECDDDHEFNLACNMQLQLCLNVPDPKVSGCPFATQPGKVFRVELLAPKGNPDAVTALTAAVQDLARAAGVAATVSGTVVSFNPPVTAAFQCGRSHVKVAARGTEGHARPGKLKLRARSSDATGKLHAVSTLTLVCNP